MTFETMTDKLARTCRFDYRSKFWYILPNGDLGGKVIYSQYNVRISKKLASHLFEAQLKVEK